MAECSSEEKMNQIIASFLVELAAIGSVVTPLYLYGDGGVSQASVTNLVNL
jgi:hypothetical protein